MRALLKVVFSKENVDQNGENARRIAIYGNLFFAFVSAILTGLNIYKGYFPMAILTSVLIMGFVISEFVAMRGHLSASHILTAVLCGVIFSIFAIKGENDGFAILWILLVPIVSSLFVGLRSSFVLSLYFQIFLIVFFYTPLRHTVSGYYTETFLMRFPLLYFATFGAVTIMMCQRQQLYNEVHRQAYYDALTGLYNRFYYNELSLRTGNKEEFPHLVIVSFDVTRLKWANDNFGHEAGDELLKGTAELIKKAFPEDICFRMGGDEFAVISKRPVIKQSLSNFKDAESKWKGELISEMHVAVGVASRDEYPELSFEELAKIADDNMYKNKSEFYRSSGLDRRTR